MHAGDIQPAMWRYRARITLEHLSHALEQNAGNTFIILKEFLRLVSIVVIRLLDSFTIIIYLILGASTEDYTIPP